MKPFQTDPDRVIAGDELFYVMRDAYPISPGHTLIVVRRVVQRFMDLTPDEKLRLVHWIDWCLVGLERLDPKPDGFNVGFNDGVAAGQTVGQLHVHVIPRYNGDIPDPRGGIRHIIGDKARYW